MNSRDQKPPLPLLLIIFFFVVTTGVVIIGFLYFSIQQKHILDLKMSEMSSISDLKARQINQLRLSRIGEAKFLSENSMLIGKFKEFLDKPESKSLQSGLTESLRALATNFNYKNVFFIDSHGTLRLSYPERDTVIGSYLRSRFPEILNERKGILTDLHKDDQVSFVHVNLAFPLIDRSGRDSTVIGLLSLRIDPNDLLYPLVQSWPSSSKSAESYLVRKEGNEILYLNELRHLKSTGLSFKKPVTEVSLPEAMALNGINVTSNGTDYRGVRVVAAMKKVPGTSWYIVSKVDIAEVFSDFKNHRDMGVTIMILFILATGSILGIFWRNQRVRFYREKFEAEQNRLALVKHFEYILKYANDIILLINEDLNILEANDRALGVYQYSREEIIRLNVVDLRPKDMVPKLFELIDILEEKESATYETIHIRKDGTLFPIEISARLVKIEGKKYYHTIGRDITDRKLAEETLKRSEEKYRELVESANSIIERFDINGRFTFVNEYFQKFFGFTEKEILGKTAIGTIIPESDSAGKDLTTLIDNLFRDPDHYVTNVNENINKNGERCWISWTNKPIFDKNGNIVEILAVGNDITKLKQAEFLIVESEERFRKMFEESPTSYSLTTSDYKIVRANPAFCNMLGYDESEVINLTFRDLSHPDYLEKDESGMKQLFSGKILVYKTEKRYFRKNKSLIWGSTTVSTIKDRSGNVKYFLAMIEDITQRREAGIQAEESNSLLRATLESTADGILVVDLNGRIVQFNSKFTEMWKIPESIMSSRDDKEALSFVRDQLKEPDSFLDNVKHLYENPNSVSFDVLNFSDGRIFERYSQPQKINNGIVGRVWSFRDITKRKIAEAELISAKEKAEESDRLKTAFLHNISHEIRTPMNAIVGFSTLLDDAELKSDARKQYIDIIYESSNQLLSIITDIVDISNIETGQTRINKTNVNINNIIRNLYEQYIGSAAKQGLSIHYDLNLNDEKALLETDGPKLIQVLTNLLNNSLKFTKKGKIEFGYKLLDSTVEFRVSDTGIGIPKDKQSRIFDRFYQVENSISRRYSGTGLGLSICKAYAELIGGSISVDSEPGIGTTFFLKIPYSPSKENSLNRESAYKKSKGTIDEKIILIAEDDDINFLVVKKCLEANNFCLIRAKNGKEAVDLCRSNCEIDLVLLDLKMPVMDGFEAMSLIREFRPDLPFIALTAFAFESDKKHALEQGCIDYISKPFSKKDLLEVLKKHL